MADPVAVIDILAMLGLFLVAFFLWVSWEVITGHKALALMLAIATFVASWLVADFVGAASPHHFLVVELVVAVVVFRVAKRNTKPESS